MAGVTHLVQPPLVVLQRHLVVRTLPAHHLWGTRRTQSNKQPLCHTGSPLNNRAIRSGSTSEVHYGVVHCSALAWCTGLHYGVVHWFIMVHVKASADNPQALGVKRPNKDLHPSVFQDLSMGLEVV